MSRAGEFPDEPRAGSTDIGGGGDGSESGGGITSRIPKLSIIGRIGGFYHNVKLEMRRTTWPTRHEVWSTTLVVLLAVLFFGFYLAGIDYVISMGFRYLEKMVK